MKNHYFSLIAVVTMLACSVPGRLAGETQPVPGDATFTAGPTDTSVPVTETPLPPTATPLPPAISAETVGRLRVSKSFAEGIVRAVDFSPDGTVLAAAEGDPAASIGTIQLYDPATGVSLGTLEGHESGVWGLGFSPDGRYLASAGRDRTAKVWDWRNHTLVYSLDFPHEVTSVAFSPDSRTLAVGGVDELPGANLEDAAIWTFAVDSWTSQLKLAEYWNISDIAYTPDGSLIIGGGTSRNVRVWKAGDGAEQFILYHPGQVGSIAVAPDGTIVATAGCEQSDASHQCVRGAVWLWSLSTGRLIATVSDFEQGVAGVVYSPDGTLLVAATPDGTLHAYSAAEQRLLWTASAPPGLFNVLIGDMALSTDGRFIATGGSGRIDVWEVGE